MKKEFQQSKGPEQFSLMLVKRTYGDFPKKIKQAYKHNVGWFEVDMIANAKNLHYLAMDLVETVQFEVMDEWDMLRYPDYKITELLK